MLRFFKNLGDQVESRWRALHYDPVAMPAIAHEALLANPPAEHVTADEILWALHENGLPYQTNYKSGFGQPPITVYNNSRFFIEALFWLTSTTNIHQHAFSGAFSVLRGSSVEGRYAFELTERVSPDFMLGQLTLDQVNLLRTGDARPISSGSKLIHSVFHLGFPSVTIVIRTAYDKESGIQYNYDPPYLATNPAIDAESDLRAESVRVLKEVRSPRVNELACLAVRTHDLYTAHNVLSQLHDGEAVADEHQVVWDCARERFGDRIDRIEAVLEESARRAIISTRRNSINDPDHRFFLALLLNVPNREQILEMVRSYEPEREPIDTVTDWVTQLSSTDIIGIEFDETNLVIFRFMLEGRSMAGIVQGLEEEFDVESVEDQLDDLKSHCDAMRDSILFKHLLARDSSAD